MVRSLGSSDPISQYSSVWMICGQATKWIEQHVECRRGEETKKELRPQGGAQRFRAITDLFAAEY